MKKGLALLLVFFLIFISFIKVALAESNEQATLQSSSFFGDLIKAKKIKKHGKIHLKVWNPYERYAEKIPNKSIRNVMLQNDNSLNISYDEVWISVMDDGFSIAEKRKWKGQFDISKIYWKDGKVQAATLDKYYISNPITNKRVRKHKNTQVWDRESVLKEVEK